MTRQIDYKQLIATYEKYSLWHEDGDSILKAIGFSNAMDPANLFVYFRKASKVNGRREEQLLSISPKDSGFLNSLQMLSHL